jgi:hypothetical protein
MEQARLQQQSAQAAQAAAARQQEQEQRMALEQQQIAQEKARTDAELGLKRQQLEQGQQEINMAAQQASQKFAATRAFQAEVGDGSDPKMVSRALLRYGTAMGAPGAAIAAAERMSIPQFAPGPVQGQPVLDPTTKAAIPGAIATPSPTGRGMQVHWSKQESDQMSPSERAQTLRALKDEKKEIIDSYGGMLMMNKFDPKTDEAKKKLKEDKDRLAEINESEKKLLPALTGKGGAQGRIRMKSPAGKIGTVPAARKQEYLDAGYKEI